MDILNINIDNIIERVRSTAHDTHDVLMPVHASIGRPCILISYTYTYITAVDKLSYFA